MKYFGVLYATQWFQQEIFVAYFSMHYILTPTYIYILNLFKPAQAKTVCYVRYSGLRKYKNLLYFQHILHL